MPHDPESPPTVRFAGSIRFRALAGMRRRVVGDFTGAVQDVDWMRGGRRKLKERTLSVQSLAENRTKTTPGFAHTFAAHATISPSPSREPGAHRVSGRAPVPDWQR